MIYNFDTILTLSGKFSLPSVIFVHHFVDLIGNDELFAAPHRRFQKIGLAVPRYSADHGLFGNDLKLTHYRFNVFPRVIGVYSPAAYIS